jgi:hypothetical protein
MARGRKTGGRQKGARNHATAEARAAAEATGILPLDYMLSIMRDANAEPKRRDAMAMAAAPYLHSRLSAVEAKPNEPAAAEVAGIRVEFVRPRPGHERNDENLHDRSVGAIEIDRHSTRSSNASSVKSW